MKRFLAASVLVLLAQGRAAADYLAIKVDVNAVTAVIGSGKGAATPGSDGGGMMGGMGMQGGGGMMGAAGKGYVFPGVQSPQFNAPPENLDVPPLWVTGFVELKSNTSNDLGEAVEIEIKGSVKTYVPKLPEFRYAQISKTPLAADFKKRLEREQKEKNAPRLIYLARWAWNHGLTKEFHAVMKELKDVEPKNAVLKRYQQIQALLAKHQPGENDPGLKSLLDDYLAEGYRVTVSEQGRYAILAKLSATPANEAQIKRRLQFLEEHFERFYYWFAFHEGVPLPPLPRKRLYAILADDFPSQHLQWGQVPHLASGFTPRRDNVMILALGRIDEPYLILDKATRTILENTRLTRDVFLSGDIYKQDVYPKDVPGPRIAAVQTLLLVQRYLEEEAERTTLSHEGTQQLLAASGILPAGVEAPDWVRAGLASYFETPFGAVYGSGGLPSWSNLVAFKYWRKTIKGPEMVENVALNRYFAQARRTWSLHLEAPDDDSLAAQLNVDWEKARATAWAFVYFLMESKQLPVLLRYTDELKQMPRDLELGEAVLEACFSKGFNLSDPKEPFRLDPAKLQALAGRWYADMESVALGLPDLEVAALKARLEAAPVRPTKSGTKSKSAPPKLKAPTKVPMN